MTKSERGTLGPCLLVLASALIAYCLVNSSLFPWPDHRATVVVAIWLYLPLLASRFDDVDVDDFGVDGRTLRLALPRTLSTAALVLLPFGLIYGLFLARFETWIPFIPLPKSGAAALNLIAFHLLFAAIPEEFFFRGYLQKRLDRFWAPRWNLWGAALGPGWLVANLAFTMCHLLPLGAPYRLLVFFPGLLFGWLRARTQSFWAAALLHFLANMTLVVVPAMMPTL